MAVFQKFNILPQNIARKVHDFNADTLKAMLTNVAPVATNAVKADITEIAAGNGYVAGGVALTGVSATQVSGTLTVACADPSFTASGGSIATARYVVFYDDTPATPLKPLIGWYDYGSAFTLAVGETLLVDLPGNLFTIA